MLLASVHAALETQSATVHALGEVKRTKSLIVPLIRMCMPGSLWKGRGALPLSDNQPSVDGTFRHHTAPVHGLIPC